MIIAIVNRSTTLTPARLAVHVAATAKAVRAFLAPIWSLPDAAIYHYTDEADVPIGAWIVAVHDDSDAAGLDGYHSTTPMGRPYARCFVRGKSDAEASTLISHEAFEALVNPGCDAWIATADGVRHAREACDAVQDWTWTIEVDGEPVTLSAFLMPPYFWTGADPSSTVFCGSEVVSLAPFALAPGGYENVILPGESAVTQLFGRAVPDDVRATKGTAGSRGAAMGATLDRATDPGPVGALAPAPLSDGDEVLG